MSSFDSLTWALEDWFDTPMHGLPAPLRERAKREFRHVPWDRLTGDQRRDYALQQDYQHDPATRKDQEFWFDFFLRQTALQKQLEEWSAIATPTASDLANKEKRLIELQRELAQMTQLSKKRQGDYYPTKPGTQGAAKLNVRYIAYPKAICRLVDRLGATPEELALWVWLGPDTGGLAAYMNANELDPPPRFHFSTGGHPDYVAALKRHSEPTVDAVAKALARFEEDTKYRDFKKFQSEQAVAFKRRLADQQNLQTGAKLSKATLHSTLGHLRAFFHWLAGQPRYKSRLQYSDAEYFNLSEKDVRVATARRDQVGPTLEQVRHVIGLMPATSPIERRNRALVAFTILTGARDSAIASLKLKHVNLVAACVDQDAREVKTKFSKTFTTYFFPVGQDVQQTVADWVAYLRQDMLWGNDDPLFPATRVVVGASRQFEAAGLERAHWSTATAIRGIFKEAFTSAGLPYFNPHSFRNTLVRYGQAKCQTPEQFKAWSQNLGHEKVMTTFLSYGQVESCRQGVIIKGLGDDPVSAQSNVSELARALMREMQNSGMDKIDK